MRGYSNQERKERELLMRLIDAMLDLKHSLKPIKKQRKKK